MIGFRGLWQRYGSGTGEKALKETSSDGEALIYLLDPGVDQYVKLPIQSFLSLEVGRIVSLQKNTGTNCVTTTESHSLAPRVTSAISFNFLKDCAK
ncbi:hypothetical protein [Halalkalicoccus sp. NIPERK01]|uniref:hypothetical protein n=1 Tax=Halalkalicoccus sp. NIPERK01 TaxID=3053469 RepID=UPI00256F023E|nr:hypothetical protein [Halalkalicoccus sp. NIPERK01]MDL5363367.1 hypothetical protein [Halalkalicoccus sp. NIPERK01]